jgi:hypothetical protein
MGFALMGLVQQQQAAIPITTISTPNQNTIKIEALTAIVTSLGEMIKLAIQLQ